MQFQILYLERKLFLFQTSISNSLEQQFALQSLVPSCSPTKIIENPRVALSCAGTGEYLDLSIDPFSD